MAEIALPLVEVYIRGYWPQHKQTNNIDAIANNRGLVSTIFLYYRPKQHTVKIALVCLLLVNKFPFFVLVELRLVGLTKF